ncbi:four helix bundle protein [Sunxiuqinia sp. A32]|uniref:four helix bundle protein n=1 Tax=Sunxiuqinia sp. A32 TaxID=3461496 RepID=UPI0040458E4D
MNSDELKLRLKKFALRIIKLSESLPNNMTGKTLSNQIIRSGTSPGANYRAACLSKSDKDFLNKLKMVEEELDETLYWLELIVESGLVKAEQLDDLKNENLELFRIIVSSINTMKKKLNSEKITS